MFVPVLSNSQKPLMPTKPSRARRWIKEGKATGFFKRGVFCVRLNVGPSDINTQEIVVGIDPGAKREGFTVKSENHTYLNVQSSTITHIKDAMAVRKTMRKFRRQRKTPYRLQRKNKKRFKNSFIPPSSKARWSIKLRICIWLTKLYPITLYIVEDVKAWSKGKKKWDTMFSPIEIGKNWFYSQLKELGEVYTKEGWETKELRDSVGLKKSKSKLSEIFEAHCVDSWVLANSIVGGHLTPDNKTILKIVPLKFPRRQLHALQPSIGGKRREYGGTRSQGFTKGSIVKHYKWGLSYIGGSSSKGISLHSIETNERICRTAKPKDLNPIGILPWRAWMIKE